MQYNSIQQHAEHSQSECPVYIWQRTCPTVRVHMWGGREQSTKPYYTYKRNSFKFWWSSVLFHSIPFVLEQGFLCPHCVPWKSPWLAHTVWPLPDAFASNLTYCQRTWLHTKFYIPWIPRCLCRRPVDASQDIQIHADSKERCSYIYLLVKLLQRLHKYHVELARNDWQHCPGDT